MMMVSEKSSSPSSNLFFRIKDLGGPIIGGTLICCDLLEKSGKSGKLLYRILLDAGLSTRKDKDTGKDKLYTYPLEKLKELLKERNVDAIILSHPHQDHVGALPWIVKYLKETKRPLPKIYATPLTKKQYQITQREFFHIYSKPAKNAGKEWCWDVSDIEESFQKIHCSPFYRSTRIDYVNGDVLSFKFYPNGHIVGSAAVEITFTNKEGLSIGNLLFTSDCCLRNGSFTVDGWQSQEFEEEIQQSHYDAVIMEGTYLLKSQKEKGDRKYIKKELAELINSKINSGNVVLCVYSIDRATNTLCCLREMIDEEKISHHPIAFDTKTGQKLDGVYKKGLEKFLGTIYDIHLKHLESGFSESIINRWRDQRLYPTRRNNGEYVEKYYVTDSKAREEILDEYQDGGGCIVVCTSATLAGGPVMDYLSRWGENRNNLFLIMGSAIPGTPAADVVYKKKRSIRIPPSRYNKSTGGGNKEVNAVINAEIKDFPLISAHAIAPELRTIASLNRSKLLLTHIGTPIEDYEKINAKVKKAAKHYDIENWTLLSPDFPTFVQLTAVHRQLVFPEELWSKLKNLARKARKKPDTKGILNIIRILIDYYQQHTK